ncbi:MAG: sugar-binding protein [Candidatus Omnitrophota bacterium]
MNKPSLKSIIIWSIAAVLTAGALFSARLFFSIDAKDNTEKLKVFARKLLEKPVIITMDSRRKRYIPLEVEEEIPQGLLVDDFDSGLTSGVFKDRKNSIGSYQGTWAMRPSCAIITKSHEVRRGNHGMGLVIDYQKESGWCGWYTLLNGADVTPYNTLTFWVKGEKGGEKFDIGLADQMMQELEIDAFYIGSVTSFIPEGFVSREWKQVKVPLSRLHSVIDLSSMGSLVFWFKYGGKGRVYVEDVQFTNDPDIARIEQFNEPKAHEDLLHPRSLWVWKIDPIASKKQRKELIDLCNKASIAVVYLFFPEFTEEPPKQYFDDMAEFLVQMHQNNIKVEALTGNPSWSLKENHHRLVNWIQFFLDYNNGRNPEERVDGVSIDVEPYLAGEWEVDKERIKKEYLDLLRKCRELIDSYDQEFKMGAAIPFFYDKEDDGDFERAILDYVDYIALMDYFDTAKDIIEHALFHIDVAKEKNRRVAIGVETQDLVEMKQGKRRNTFKEEGWEGMERELAKVKEAFFYDPSFEGFAIHCYDSYRLMTRGRNVPTKERPKDLYSIRALKKDTDVLIDGYLNEWDLSAPMIVANKKNVVYGQSLWGGPGDLDFKCYAAWDEEALYIALDVVDDIFVQNKAGKDMWEGDHVELWLDVDLTGDYNEAVNSDDDFQIGISAGNFAELKPEVYIWTPALPDKLEYKNLIEVASAQTLGGYSLEVKIPRSVMFFEGQALRIGAGPSQDQGEDTPVIFKMDADGPSVLHEGFDIGIMVDVGDTDDGNTPMKCLMSTSNNRIWGDPTTFGILRLE